MAIPAPYFYNTIFAYDGFGRRIKKDNIEFIYDNDGNLIAQSDGQNTLEFIYNAMDIIGVKYDEKQYFYRKDAQGNIIAILDSAGNVVVKYIYDCWGNHAIVAETGEDVTDGIGILNPFRYRGYYFDTETQLYYLQTRYYDPEIGRFISQDSVEYASLGINGLNLYAYCANNPVSYLDIVGTNWFSNLLRGIGGFIIGVVGAVVAVAATLASLVFPPMTMLAQVGVSVAMYGGFMMASSWDSQIKADMDAIGWNPFNSNAELVHPKSSEAKVSFYKGIPIIRTNLGRSGTFGIMFLRRGNNVSVEEVKHEFGHIPQLLILGTVNFAVTVGIPSCFEIGIGEGNIWEDYYTAPWEVMAEMFGGANNSKKPLTDSQKGMAIAYFALSFYFGNFIYSFLR